MALQRLNNGLSNNVWLITVFIVKKSAICGRVHEVTYNLHIYLALVQLLGKQKQRALMHA